MRKTAPVSLAWRLALGVPVLLIGGAYLAQYGFGLYPCEICWWQRYPHFAAIVLAAVAGFVPPPRLWLWLAGLAILASGLIGLWHAGIEYGWWEGVTACSRPLTAGSDPLEAIMNAPLSRCDEAPWSLLGVSLAGWNFLISTCAALVIGWLLTRKAA